MVAKVWRSTNGKLIRSGGGKAIRCDVCPCNGREPSYPVCLDYCDPAASSQMLLNVAAVCGGGSPEPSGVFVCEWSGDGSENCTWRYRSPNLSDTPETTFLGFNWFVLLLPLGGGGRRWEARLNVVDGPLVGTKAVCLINRWALNVPAEVGAPIDCLASRELTIVHTGSTCFWPCNIGGSGSRWNDDLDPPETITLVGG